MRPGSPNSISASRPRRDIPQSTRTRQVKGPDVLHVGAIVDQRARVRPPSRLIEMSPITAPDLVQIVAALRLRRDTSGSKAFRRQLRLSPLSAPPPFDRQRLAGLDIQDDPVDLGAVQRAP